MRADQATHSDFAMVMMNYNAAEGRVKPSDHIINQIIDHSSYTPMKEGKTSRNNQLISPHYR